MDILKTTNFMIKKVQKKFEKGVLNYQNGEWKEVKSGKSLDLFTPLTGEKISKVVMSESEDLEEMIQAIKEVQKEWSQLTFKKRAEVMYQYRDLLKQNESELARIIHVENGKCLKDAHAEIAKAIETVEYACSIPNIVAGKIEEVSRNVWAFDEQRPLGIVSSITPFNFPVMVPHWTIAHAMVMGNAMILKPSEQTPLSSAYITKLWEKAGLPKGIFNLYNGGEEAVMALCQNKDIQAISFVGSTKVAKIVYQKGAVTGKRILALGGAKNFILISKTVNPKAIVKDLISSAYGMVGQRCMAVSVIVTIGKNDEFVNELKSKLNKMIVGPNVDDKEGLSPLANIAGKKKILDYLEYAKQKGAKILVDGTKFQPMKEFKNGYYLGPTLVDWTQNPLAMSEEEIFGPILEIIQAQDLNEALKIQNASIYGNGAAIFTESGKEAFEVVKKFEAGMIGINVGVPIPREPLSFGGIKMSKFGYGDITGPQASNFWSNLIKTTFKWNTAEKKIG